MPVSSTQGRDAKERHVAGMRGTSPTSTGKSISAAAAAAASADSASGPRSHRPTAATRVLTCRPVGVRV